MTCLDCMGHDFCMSLYENPSSRNMVEQLCPKFKSKSRFIELPCNENDIRVVINKLFTDDNSRLKAIVSVAFGDFAVHCIRIFETDNGLFVQMPMITSKREGNIHQTEVFQPLTNNARMTLIDSIISGYEAALKKQKEE